MAAALSGSKLQEREGGETAGGLTTEAEKGWIRRRGGSSGAQQGKEAAGRASITGGGGAGRPASQSLRSRLFSGVMYHHLSMAISQPVNLKSISLRLTFLLNLIVFSFCFDFRDPCVHI